MKNKKFTFVLAKSISALALTFSMGSGTVFADDQVTGTSTAPVTTGNTNSVSTQTTAGTTVSTTGTTNTVVSVQAPQKEIEEPSLIPGDFFYFVKMMVEKIRLAVTVDDKKEAQLLAEFASERIAEANELLVEGDKEDAEKILKEAISTQELAKEKLPETEDKVSEDAKGTDIIPVKENTEETKVESKLANNIDSLIVVLEKIDNPKAQKAIMKNIQKSFKKIDKKFARLEEAEAKFTEKMNEIDGKLVSGEMSTEEANSKKSKLAAELAKKKQEIEEKEAKDVEKINKEVARKTAEAVQEQKEKEQEALKKAEEKKLEEAKKAEEKRREEAKKAAEKQRETIKKAREKQREHDDDDEDDDHDHGDHEDHDHDHGHDHDDDEHEDEDED